RTKLFSLYSRLINGAVIIEKNKQSELRSMLAELKYSATLAVNKEESKLSSLGARLDAISPLKLLSSGYAKVYSADKVIDSVSKVKSGDEIELLLADGTINAMVNSVKPRK
ncbi:MAG: hypothetical protein IJY70_03540, partial [Clostridia bacterium]|nr:hypothetical protein [Clostridia bacterium]